MKRLSPRERVAAHLRALGYDVEAEEIHHVHGGPHKTLNDIVECWHVFTGPCNKRIEIQGADTLTRCANGITLEPNTPNTCLYGDLIAYPNGKTQFKP